MSHTLDAARIGRLLETERFGRSLDLRDSTSSTNDDAREALAAGAADGHVVLADAQSQGRGARGRLWISPPGTDLYLSIVARPKLPLAALPPLTLAIGVAVAETVDHFLGDATATVKWPNDVLCDGSKIAGILLESSSSGNAAEAPAVVIGVGLNVGRMEFPAELDFPGTSLRLALGDARPQPAREEVLAVLLAHAEAWVDRMVSHGAAPVVEAVDARLALRGRQVQVEKLTGEVLGVASDGSLRLRASVDGGGEKRAASGRLRPVD